MKTRKLKIECDFSFWSWYEPNSSFWSVCVFVCVCVLYDIMWRPTCVHNKYFIPAPFYFVHMKNRAYDLCFSKKKKTNLYTVFMRACKLNWRHTHTQINLFIHSFIHLLQQQQQHTRRLWIIHIWFFMFACLFVVYFSDFDFD